MRRVRLPPFRAGVEVILQPLAVQGHRRCPRLKNKRTSVSSALTLTNLETPHLSSLPLSRRWRSSIAALQISTATLGMAAGRSLAQPKAESRFLLISQDSCHVPAAAAYQHILPWVDDDRCSTNDKSSLGAFLQAGVSNADLVAKAEPAEDAE